MTSPLAQFQLADLIDTGAWIDALGWTLLHFTWQGLLIGCATALLLLVMRNAHPVYRYQVGCAALLACLLWPAATLVGRLGSGGARVASAMSAADTAASSDIVSGGVLSFLQSQLVVIVGFWALCALLMALRLAFGLAWIRRSTAQATVDAGWQARADQMAARFGIERPVTVRVVRHLNSPVTAGWLRPVVLLPAALISGMPLELLSALLAHEMAHIRRLDYLVNLGQNMIEALLFYHPAVWWISGQVRNERERVADDLAARYLTEPRQLAHALSELARLQCPAAQLAQAATGGDLVGRIRALVRPDRQALNWKAAVPVMALSAACLTLIVQATSVNAEPVTPAAAAAQAQTPPTALAQASTQSEAPSISAVPHPDEAGDQASDTGHVPARANFNSCSKPVWPAGAIKAQRTGRVTLNFEIGVDGRVIDSKVRRSSGHPDLDQAARDGIAKCTFKPATDHGQPVRQWMQMQYVWTLK